MAEWHPIMTAQEYEPGRWVIFDVYERPYGMIDFVRRGDELGYKATLWAQNAGERALIGYYRNLRAAAHAVHMLKINEGVPHGHPADIPSRRNGVQTTANTPRRTERD